MIGKVSFLFCFIFFLPCIIKAQEIKVRVVDDTDGQPVPFCHICVENKETGQQQYQVGDVNGEALVPIGGNIILSVTAMGYESYFQEQGLNGKLLEIRLKPGYFGLEEVVVTGQYKPVSVDKSIYDIKLLGKTKIETQAANNVADLLSNELNFKINHSSATGTSLNLQGISGENVKILVDGVPLIGRLDGSIDISQINLENVDHVEVVEGPMSVVYGSNALAGVVNIITKENKYSRFKGGIHGYYESVGIYNLNGNLDTRFGKHGISLTGGRNFFGGYSLVDTSRYKEYKPKEQYNLGTVYTYTTDKTSIKYKIDYFKENLLNRSHPIPPYNEKGFETWTATTRFNNSLHFNRQLSEFNSINLMAAYSYYDRSRSGYFKDLTDLSSVFMGTDSSVFHAITARGGLNHTNEASKLDYQLGFDINTELGIGDRLVSERESIGDYALFASAKWKPVANFTIQPALRVSYNTDYDSPVTPSLNIKYELNNTIFRLSYARGFRAPSLKELYLNFYDSNHALDGNPDLIAETSHNFNVALTYKATIASRPIRINGKVYYNVIEDKIQLVQVHPDSALHYRSENVGHIETFGGDLTLGVYPIPTLSIEAGMAYLAWIGEIYNYELHASPSAVTNMTLSLLKNRASVSMYYKYTGQYPNSRYATKEEIENGYDGEIIVEYLEPYHNLDLIMQVKLYRKQLILSTGVKNILNNTQIAGLSSGSGHGGGGSTTSSLVGWGRTIFLGVKYQFQAN